MGTTKANHSGIFGCLLLEGQKKYDMDAMEHLQRISLFSNDDMRAVKIVRGE
jgi:hypothetical protein